jgi:cardiolipin synthase
MLTPRKRFPLVRLNVTLPQRRRVFADFIRRLRSAKHRIWITNAYLAPSPTLIRTLTRAARLGVDVRLLVPRESDVFFMPWVATVHYALLFAAGVRIYEYLPRFLHAKSVIIDDWATIGTSNLNHRSLLFDLEVDIALSSHDAIEQLAEQYLRDLHDAEELLETRSGFTAWLGRMVTYFFRELI